MSRVMGVMEREVIGYRFRTSLFGKQVLQIEERILMWDTNTGGIEPYPRVKWRDATADDNVQPPRVKKPRKKN